MMKQIINKRKTMVITVVVASCICLTGCSIAGFGGVLKKLKGSLKGNSFTCKFYDNMGNQFLTVNGEQINLENNIVREQSIDNEGDVAYTNAISSIMTLTIDGNEMESCGDTIIFQETGLEPDMQFTLEDVESESEKGLSDTTLVAGVVNKYKNYFGKERVVIVKSQLGSPICAYSGKDVYWENQSDLPKTTLIMIDGKALYIHRSNFQIIDKSLISQ